MSPTVTAPACHHGPQRIPPVRSAVGIAAGRATGVVDVRVGTAHAALGFTLTSLGACLVLFAADFGIPRAQVAWLSSTFGVGLLVVAGLGVPILREGPGWALRIASVAVAGGAAALATAPTLPVAGAGALLVGLGGAVTVLVTPLFLHGPGAAPRLLRVTAAASVACVFGPLVVATLGALGVSGRLALLTPVPALLMLAATRAPAVESPIPGAAPARVPFGRAAVGWTRVVLAVSVEFCFVIWSVARLQEGGAGTSTAAALSSAFPIGLAVGRLAGPRLLRSAPPTPVAVVTTTVGALLVCFGATPAPVTAGLAFAGLGVAVLYPITLAQLVNTPGLSHQRAAALGALASGTAILAAPNALAALGTSTDLHTAFLVTIPLLATLLVLRPGPVTAPSG